MKINWTWVVIVAVLVAASAAVAIFGPMEIATGLLGLASGLIVRAGALGKPDSTEEITEDLTVDVKGHLLAQDLGQLDLSVQRVVRVEVLRELG